MLPSFVLPCTRTSLTLGSFEVYLAWGISGKCQTTQSHWDKCTDDRFWVENKQNFSQCNSGPSHQKCFSLIPFRLYWILLDIKALLRLLYVGFHRTFQRRKSGGHTIPTRNIRRIRLQLIICWKSYLVGRHFQQGRKPYPCDAGGRDWGMMGRGSLRVFKKILWLSTSVASKFLCWRKV